MTHETIGEQAFAGLAALLDDIRDRRTIPAGMRGRVYAIIDGLRAAGAPASRIHAAERIALTVHALEWARLRKLSDEEDALWRQLNDQSSEWTHGPANLVRRIEL